MLLLFFTSRALPLETDKALTPQKTHQDVDPDIERLMANIVEVNDRKPDDRKYGGLPPPKQLRKNWTHLAKD